MIYESGAVKSGVPWPVSPRTYTMRKRAEATESTRRAILDAARAVAAEDGLSRLTVDRVADAAGVSRLTVYNHFESRTGLLEALAWSAFAGADIERVRQARLLPDVDTALRTFVTENARFLSTIGPQGRAVMAAAIADEELGSVMEATYIAGRRASIAELVARLARERRLPRGMTRDKAVAALMVITSLESFETVTTHAGWSTDKGGELLADMAVACLTPASSVTCPP